MHTTELNIVMAQLNMLVGDIEGNTLKIIESARLAAEQGADVVVFPELSLLGYPPEDLLLRPSLEVRTNSALQQIQAALPELTIVVGYARRRDGQLFNMAGVIQGGQLVAEYAKQHLPNFQVFDEKRYFSAGNQPCVVDIQGLPVALSICEDIWHSGVMAQARGAGAKLMLNINASPFHIDKPLHRAEMLKARVAEGQMPVLYVNQVGGQDELVFDGGSLALDAQGNVKVSAPTYLEHLAYVGVHYDGQHCVISNEALYPSRDRLESIYQALVLGVQDYVNKNHFKGVLLGLSGGIDSALTLAIAVDALGPERVEAVMMPFKYTSAMSLTDAEQQAHTMGVSYKVFSIEPMFDAFMQTLQDEFAGTARDTTEENLQARCRGVLLMALSNKKGYMVLTTGNKSEVAVGYCTLYGDMVGGYNALKDVFKTLVYELARYRNSLGEVIPQRVIERAPSAELAPDQKDQDSLPPYEVLDEILRLYIEEDVSAAGIMQRGFSEADVKRVVRLVDVNEYKRRQAAVGVRLTQRGFGRDRRYPITNGWQQGV